MNTTASEFLLCFLVYFVIVSHHSYTLHSHLNSTCGIDNSPMTMVYEGYSKIEYYPWMGYLFYPQEDDTQLTTSVLLVSSQIVIASANEIEKLPKRDFRKRARVVLGSNCSDAGVGIQEYSYHPLYGKSTYSEMAIIQLQAHSDLRPICPPPTHFEHPTFYAMSFPEDCYDSRIQIHRMTHVDMAQCKDFYRRSMLDVQSFWPEHTACARDIAAKQACVWRSGSALVLRQGKRWMLMGFGVYGPGCSQPARFLDYGMYHPWVKSNILRAGKPALTQLEEDYVVLRRKLSSVQRFGPCDEEELYDEIYSDHTNITNIEGWGRWQKLIYNLTLFSNMEYHCVVFRVLYKQQSLHPMPARLRLRRWCAAPLGMCHGWQYLQIDFYVEIDYRSDCVFRVSAYGSKPQAIDVRKAMLHQNHWRARKPFIDPYVYKEGTKFNVTPYLDNQTQWFN